MIQIKNNKGEVADMFKNSLYTDGVEIYKLKHTGFGTCNCEDVSSQYTITDTRIEKVREYIIPIKNSLEESGNKSWFSDVYELVVNIEKITNEV